MRRKPLDQPAQAKPTTRLSDVQPEPARGRKRAGRKREHISQAGAPDSGGLETMDACPSRRERDREDSPKVSTPTKEPKPGRWSPMARAVAMLSRREHSQAEIVRKLMDKGVAEDEARKVVEELAELGLQSDQRFLESRVRQRVGGGYGPGRARVDLARQGLDEVAVETAVEAPGGAWLQGAYDLIERRFGVSPLPLEVRRKALGLLVRRGFSFEDAQQVIREPRPEVEQDPGLD